MSPGMVGIVPETQLEQLSSRGDLDPAVLKGMSSKQLNAASILALAWNTDVFTASDAISATNLTRTTVISLCEELVGNGWLIELADARSTQEYSKGRPARRYTLNALAGVGVGLDAGDTWMVARVSDLRGRVIGRAESREVVESSTVEERLAGAQSVVEAALRDASVPPHHALRLTIGVPAPVNSSGESPERPGGFWHLMNPGMGTYFEQLGYSADVENDATLAAIAEGLVGSGRGLSSFIAFLNKDGLGAGIVSDGRPVRGYHGAAGELWMLDYIDPLRHKGDAAAEPGHARTRGINSALGLDNTMRMQATRGAALVEATGSVLTGMEREAITAQVVLGACAQGDAFACEIIDDTAQRLARSCVTLAGMLDVERIILSGTGPELAPFVERVNRLTPQYWHPNFPPPPIVLSELGGDVVVVGAIAQSLEWIRTNVFRLVSTRAPAMVAL